MRYTTQLLCLVFWLCLTSSGFCLSVPFEEAVCSVFNSDSEVKIIYSEPTQCFLTHIPETVEELDLLAYQSCQLRIRHLKNAEMPILQVYKTSGIFSAPTQVLYTKLGGSLFDFFRRYFPDWELQGEAVSSVILPNSWKRADIQSLQQQLEDDFKVYVNNSGRCFYVLSATEDVQVPDLNFAIFYKFPTLNQDLYELVRSYATQVKLVRYARDQQVYLQIAEPAPSREELTKTYIYLKALLDDRATKAQKLGTYFMKNERLNLQLLYVLLSDAEILAFHPGELTELSTSILSPLGLEAEKTQIKNRLKSEPSTVLELPAALAQKTRSHKKSSRSVHASRTLTSTKSKKKKKMKATTKPSSQNHEQVTTTSDGAEVTTATVDGKVLRIPKMRK